METRVLELTPWYSPHKIIHWHDAIRLIYEEKVDVVAEYEEIISSPSISMHMPAVIRLKKTIGNYKRGVKFSRDNLFTRDNYQCQYCGVRGSKGDLTFDHVLPRHQGGKTVWNNIVTACRPCNQKKKNRTPEEAGMKLLGSVYKPKALPMMPLIVDRQKAHELWVPWLVAA